MKIIRKDQTEKLKNSEACLATEYPLSDKDINGAIIELTGRYPAQGRVVNLECKEMSFVVKGSGKVVVENKAINLEAGDLILIEPGEKYFWDGNLTLFIACTPAWHPAQHQTTE